MKRIPRNVIIVAFVALFSGLGQDLITPVLPGFLITLGLSRASIGLIDGLLSGATNIFRFVSGFLSDRFHNRKTFVFLGYAFSSVARPLLALTGSILPIAALRTIDGVGKGMKDAPRDALIADSTTREIFGRAFGFHRLVDTAGSVLGPLIAGALLLAFLPSLHTYRLIFAFAAIPGFIVLALIWFGVREPEKKATSNKGQVIMVGKKLGWIFWIFTFATAIAMLTRVNDSLFLVRAGDVGIPSAWIPILFAGFTLIYAALSYPIGILSDRIGKLPLIAVGWLVLSGVEIGFAFDSKLLPSLLLFAFFGLFYALTEGSGRAFIADIVSTEDRGSAYAIFHTIVGLAVIVGGYGLGRIWDLLSPQTTFAVASIGSFVAFTIFFFMIFKRRIAT